MPDSPLLFTAGLEPGRLAGQVIVVLGAATPLGQQVAHTLAYLGAQVVVTENVSAPPSAAAAPAGPGIRHLPSAADDEASLAALAAQVQAAFGPVQALVLCPPEPARRPFLSLSAAEWDQAVSAPLRAAFLAAQAFLPAMLTRRQGTLLTLALSEPESAGTASAAGQHGLLGFTQALAAEVRGQGVHVLALAEAAPATPARLAGAAAYLLLHPTAAGPTGVATLGAVLAHAGFGASAAPDAPAAPADRTAQLAQALFLTQQLASLLVDTDSEFDRLPIGVRPLARGAFVSQVGYRSQDVLRAVNKLGDQLQRMQGSHSGLDPEFPVDYPLLTGILERLAGYYSALPAEAARVVTDPALLDQLGRQVADRVSLLEKLLASLRAVHG